MIEEKMLFRVVASHIIEHSKLFSVVGSLWPKIKVWAPALLRNMNELFHCHRKHVCKILGGNLISKIATTQ